jgi:ABC-type nitrate/sulfonate/bicarbonate transport system substrate-binding protein
VKNPLGTKHVVTVAAILALLGGCGVSQSDTPPTATRGLCELDEAPTDLEPFTAILTAGISTAPYIEWGINEGCFAKHGLDLTTLPSGASGAEKLAALVGGSADIASDGVSEVLTIMSNADLAMTIVSGAYEYTQAGIDQALEGELVDGKLPLEFAIMAAPGTEYKEVSSLVGRRIAVAPGTGQNTIALKRYVRAGEDQLDLVGIDRAERLVALLRGDVDFALIGGAEVYEALEAGATIAFFPGAYLYQPSAAVVWYTTQELSESRHDQIAAFQAALIEIHEHLNDPANLDQFTAFLAEEFGLAPEVIERFSMPKLVTRPLSIEEFDYWIPILAEEQIVGSDFTIPRDALFISSQ